MDPFTLIILIAFLSGIILGLILGVKMAHIPLQRRMYHGERMY